VGASFHRLLHFYGLEVTHLKPNSIAQIAIFIHLCEGYLGIAPHFNMWRALYRLKGHPSNIRRNIMDGAAFSLHQGSVYPNFELCDTNKGWVREWFVVANPRAGVQGVLRGAADHRGEGAGGAPPQGDCRLVGTRPDRGRGGPLSGILASRINPQVHGYRCSFHLRVFQGLSNPQRTCVH
jgi:hypothetical protein